MWEGSTGQSSPELNLIGPMFERKSQETVLTVPEDQGQWVTYMPFVSFLKLP